MSILPFYLVLILSILFFGDTISSSKLRGLVGTKNQMQALSMQSMSFKPLSHLPNPSPLIYLFFKLLGHNWRRSEITPGRRLKETHGMSGTESRPAACKANVLPVVLSLCSPCFNEVPTKYQRDFPNPVWNIIFLAFNYCLCPFPLSQYFQSCHHSSLSVSILPLSLSS